MNARRTFLLLPMFVALDWWRAFLNAQAKFDDKDPQALALFDISDFSGKHVAAIGTCGARAKKIS
jgi:hypothetical protein